SAHRGRAWRGDHCCGHGFELEGLGVSNQCSDRGRRCGRGSLIMADIVITQLGPLWTLAEVKAAIHVDHDDEDALIQSYMDAAEKALLRFCNLSLVPYGQEAVFKAAGFLTVGAFYDGRSGEEGDGLPLAARRRVHPYRWLPS